MEKPISVSGCKVVYSYNRDSTGRANWLHNEAVMADIYYHVCGQNFVRIANAQISDGAEHEMGDSVFFPLHQLPNLTAGLRKLMKDAGIDE